MMIVAQKIASRIGFKEPAAKGARVSGMRPADINLIFGSASCWRNILHQTSQKSSDSSHELAREAGLARDR